jgi:hypothetical protein
LIVAERIIRSSKAGRQEPTVAVPLTNAEHLASFLTLSGSARAAITGNVRTVAMADSPVSPFRMATRTE